MNLNRRARSGIWRWETIRLVMALALFTTAAGCVGPIRVRSVYGPGIRLDGLGSRYDWVSDSAGRPTNPQFDQLIRDTFDQQLAAKGFTPTQDAPPDFKLDYRVGRIVKGDLVNERTYEEGSLIIDLLDPGSGQIIWRGIADAVVHASDPPEARQKRIVEAVRRLMDEFPPRLGSPEPGKP